MLKSVNGSVAAARDERSIGSAPAFDRQQSPPSSFWLPLAKGDLQGAQFSLILPLQFESSVGLEHDSGW
jgi:hypothetical protein